MVVASAGLFLLLDFAVTPLLRSRPNPEAAFRTASPLFHHGLRPNVVFDDASWRGLRYQVRTNSLGFKDAAVRSVEPRPPETRHRVVFIGDSVTEGVGLQFEDTFVGQFAAARPDLDVLNGAAVSYSPSIYWRKIAWLLDEGFAFDELVVYIDISDVQDEAVFYRETADGRIGDSGWGISNSAVVGNPLPIWPPDPVRTWLDSHLHFTQKVRFVAREVFGWMRGVTEGGAKPRVRASWTLDPQATGYGEAGAEGGIAKAIVYMDRLKALVDRHGIALSVAVYPWPDQLDYDTVDSRQVRIWRDWCARRTCARFIDHFADFFAFRRDHADWRERLFMPSDIHFTRAGSEVIAARLKSAWAKDAVN